MTNRSVFIFLLLFSVSCSFLENKKVLSPIENIDLLINGHKISLEAKIDSGAKLATLDARNIRKINNDLVEFDYFDRKTNKTLTLKSKFKSFAFVRNSSGTITKRFTVETELFIKGESRMIEVTLFDRKKMNYPMILGRDSVKGYLINPNGLN